MERFAGMSSSEIRSEIEFEDRISREAFDPSMITSLWGFVEPFAFGISFGAVLLRAIRAKGGGGLSGSLAKAGRFIFNLMPPDLKSILGKKCDGVPSPKSKAPSPVSWEAYIRWFELLRANPADDSLRRLPKGWPDTRNLPRTREEWKTVKPLPKLKFQMMNPDSAKRLAVWMDNLPGGVGHYKSYLWMAYDVGRTRLHGWKDPAASDLWQCWLSNELRQHGTTSSESDAGLMRALVDVSDNPFEDFVKHFENWEYKIDKVMDRARKSFDKKLERARKKWQKLDPEKRQKILSQAKDIDRSRVKKLVNFRDIGTIKNLQEQIAVVEALS